MDIFVNSNLMEQGCMMIDDMLLVMLTVMFLLLGLSSASMWYCLLGTGQV